MSMVYWIYRNEKVCAMENKNAIQLFEDQPIRAAWDEEKEEWFFSIVDVVRVLTEQPSQRGASNYLSATDLRLLPSIAASVSPNSCLHLAVKVALLIPVPHRR